MHAPSLSVLLAHAKVEDSNGSGREAESVTKLEVEMTLPCTHDSIDPGHAGTNTSWSTVDNNRCQVLDRGAMYIEVGSNVKIKQERFADLDAIDTNTEPCNADGCDGDLQ